MTKFNINQLFNHWVYPKTSIMFELYKSHYPFQSLLVYIEHSNTMVRRLYILPSVSPVTHHMVKNKVKFEYLLDLELYKLMMTTG